MTFPPLLSIVTRTHKRPKMLYRCLASVAKIEGSDYEHIILFDEVGGGTKHANELFDIHKDRIHGRYVFILDDDDIFVCKHVLRALRKISEEKNPDIIIAKMYSEARHIDLPNYWRKREVRIGHIGSSSFFVKNEAWKKYIYVFGLGSCGDARFLKALFQAPENYVVVWWDQRVARIPHEHKGKGGN